MQSICFSVFLLLVQQLALRLGQQLALLLRQTVLLLGLLIYDWV
jgi:hypothetical protein